MRDPYKRRATKPLPREELAPVATVDLASEERDPLAEAKALARTGEDDIVTMARCPLCAGQGMVPPEVAATFDGLCRDLKART